MLALVAGAGLLPRPAAAHTAMDTPALCVVLTATGNHLRPDCLANRIAMDRGEHARALAAVQRIDRLLTLDVLGGQLRPSVGRGSSAYISWTKSQATSLSSEAALVSTIRLGLAVADGRRPVWSVRMRASVFRAHNVRIPAASARP